MKIRIYLIAALLLPVSAMAQGSFHSYVKDNVSPRQHPVDIQKMKLEVSFVPKDGLVKGKVTHTLTPLQKKVDTIFFDAPGIRISEASLNGSKLNFKMSKLGVTVYPSPSLEWDKNYDISFVYEANPRRGIYFIGWNDPNNLSRKQVWTQGQGIDNRHWIPMYDDMNDKFITETVITFDKQYQVLSNGVKLKEKENKDGTKTWNYAMSHPHAGYLLMLAIGDYAVKSTKSKSGVPVNFWYYPQFPERLEPTSRYTEQMVDFMEDETGMKYPWESYSQVMVQDFLYGAMENTTATIFGDFFNVDARGFLDRNYVGVNCHEFVHQWFGDYVTARAGNDTWLQESFATHYPKYFTRLVYGEDMFQWARRGEQNGVLEAGKKDRIPVRNTQAGTARVYGKGSAVLDMLRYVLGDEEYKRALNRYLQRHAYANVETNDLNQAIQDKLGVSLDWFFDQWIYRGGEPAYEVSWQTGTGKDLDNSGTELSITPNRPVNQALTQVLVKQTHAIDDVVGYFKMPFVFHVYYADGTYDSAKVMIDQPSQVIEIPNLSAKQVAFVLFDPNGRVLKTVKFNKSILENKQQLKLAKNMIDRYDALLGLKETPAAEKRTELIDAFNKETFFAMRAEVVNQLASDTDPASVEIIKKAFADKDVNVRTAAANGIKTISLEWRPYFENLLKDSSYNLLQLALERLVNEHPSEATRYLELTKNEVGINNAVRIKWLELAWFNSLAKGDPAKEHAEELVRYAGQSYEFRTRINAMTALKSLNYLNDSLITNLVNSLLSTNSRLAGPAATLVEYFMAQGDKKRAMKSYYAGRTWEPWQKDILNKYFM
jgi:aminopeptidase N